MWALALLLLCELLVRGFYDPQHVDPELFGDNYPDHNYAFARARPRCWRSPGRIDCWGDEYQRIPHQTLVDPKPEGSVRVIVIGTSPSNGVHAYPTMLAAPLRKRLGREVEVLNFSVRGHGTTRMIEQLDEALTLDPDIIVLHPHGTNEYEDDRDAAHVEELHEGVPGLIRRSEYATVLQKFASTQVYARARDVVDLRQKKKQAAETAETAATEAEAGRNPETLARWHANIEANTQTMVARARAAGLEVVLVGRAQRPGSEDIGWLEYMDGLLRPLAAEQGVAYIDAMAVLEQAARNVDKAFVDSTHLSELGHRALARALAEQIAARVAEVQR